MARKFKKGPVIPHVIDLMFVLLRGRAVWFKDKPLNAEFILNMTMRNIIKHAEAGNFYYCLEVK